MFGDLVFALANHFHQVMNHSYRRIPFGLIIKHSSMGFWCHVGADDCYVASFFHFAKK
jgi:hypothetical protein